MFDKETPPPRDFSCFEDMSTEMLEAIIRADMEVTNEQESDTEAILYILDVLAERKAAQDLDIDKAWETFQKDYLPRVNEPPLYEEDPSEEPVCFRPVLLPKKKHRFLRLAATAAIVSLVFFIATVTAYAMGCDLWGSVAHWTADVLYLSPEKTVAMSEKLISEGSMENVLNFSLEDCPLPTWPPDGYSLKSLNTDYTSHESIIIAEFTKGTDSLSLFVANSSVEDSFIFEKDDASVREYTKNGYTVYIFTNGNECTSVWQYETYICNISGNIPFEEMEKIVQSIS